MFNVVIKIIKPNAPEDRAYKGENIWNHTLSKTERTEAEQKMNRNDINSLLHHHFMHLNTHTTFKKYFLNAQINSKCLQCI